MAAVCLYCRRPWTEERGHPCWAGAIADLQSLVETLERLGATVEARIAADEQATPGGAS